MGSSSGSRRAIAASAVAVCVLASVAGAQRSFVSVHGIAYDSLRSAPLADAFITIGGARSATSDSLGRFQFDSVAPGTYTFAMQHSALDSLGLSGVSVKATITDGSGEVRVALPSFATIWRAACGSGQPPADSGLVYGTVRSAPGRAPVGNATVDLSWVDITVDGAKHIAQKRFHSETHTDAAGGYGVCGVPADVTLQIRASAAAATSGVIDLAPRGYRVQRRDLLVAVVKDSSTRGTIVGVVTDPTGNPVYTARVAVDDMTEVRTDDNGHFTVRDVLPGTRQLEVMFVGMAPTVTAVDVGIGDTTNVAVELRKVTTLEAVKVKATVRQRMLSEIDERRKSGFGAFADSSAIGIQGSITSVFDGFASVQVARDRRGARILALTLPSPKGGRCAATLWIDGTPQNGADDLNSIFTTDIAAVEVYPNAFSVPMIFMRPPQVCGAVVVWTKRMVR